MEAPIDVLVSELSETRGAISRDLALLIRNRAAASLHAAPQESGRLAEALHARAAREDAPADILAIAWRARAEAAIYLGSLRHANRAYQHASTLAATARDPALRGQILVGWVHVLGMLGERRNSESRAAEAEQLLRRAGDEEYLRKLLMNRAGLLYHEERYAEAYHAYQRVVRRFERSGTRDGTYVALRLNLAVACTNLLRLDEARQLFIATEELAREIGLDFVVGHARFNRAELERLEGRYRLALPLLISAQEVFAEAGARDMQASVERAKAEIHLDLEMPEEAHTHATAAVAAFRGEEMELDATLAEFLLARAELALGRAEEAEQRLATMRDFFTASRLPLRVAQVDVERARALLQRGRAEDAGHVARLATRALDRLDRPAQAAMARSVWARAVLARGRSGAAERVLETVLPSLARLAPSVRQQVWTAAAECAAARGDRGEAERRYRLAAAAVEAERRMVPRGELRTRVFDRQSSVYRALLALAIAEERPRIDAVLRWILASRARGYLDRSGPGNRSTTTRLEARRTELASLTRRIEQLEFAGGSSAAELRPMRSRRHQLERGLAEEVRTLEARVGEAGRGRDRISLRTLQARLADDDALVIYQFVNDRVVALALRSDAGRIHELPCDLPQIEADLARLRLQIDTMTVTSGTVDPDRTDSESTGGNLAFQRRAADRLLASLAERLIEPLRSSLPASGRLIVVPHGPLHQVPFEAFRVDGEYVDARWSVVRTPLAGGEASPARSTGAAGVLIAGVELPELPELPAELEMVAELLAVDPTSVVLNPSRAELLAGMVGRRAIHLATHGRFREDNPAFSSLTVADGVVFMAELADLSLSADLVVLSACSTGRVFPGRGEDLAGVTHAFLAAGGRNLVAPLWRIREGATRDWMAAFYRSWTTHGDSALAAREAARSTRALWDHPYFWGAFTCHISRI